MLSWMPVILLHIPLLLLGFVTVPIALLFPRWPRLLWLWGNDEEGCPDWWLDMAKMKGGFIGYFPCFWWYAIRNPVNNFRFIFKDREAKTDDNWYDGVPMEAEQILEAGRVWAYRWSWNGPFASYRYVGIRLDGDDLRYTEFWIGWKIGSSVPGMGFTTQYRRNRKIGT